MDMPTAMLAYAITALSSNPVRDVLSVATCSLCGEGGVGMQARDLLCLL